jgi:uncharacterized membrane protein YedE/YeeE
MTAYDRKTWRGRSAKFVYNHIQSPSMLLWLAEAIGIYLTYGASHTHAIIRNFPVGVGSIILYILSIPITFPLWGIYGGTAASLGASFLYLAAVALLGGSNSARRPA